MPVTKCQKTIAKPTPHYYSKKISNQREAKIALQACCTSAGWPQGKIGAVSRTPGELDHQPASIAAAAAAVQVRREEAPPGGPNCRSFQAMPKFESVRQKSR
jgi:hypothetical protein